MPKFNVDVCRIAYQHMTIQVEAKDEEHAKRKAEDEAGNYLFPTENHSEYQAQGATEI